MEREGIAVLHDADHSLAGIEDDLITIVVVVPRGTVIGGLLPIHVNPPAIRKEPAISRGVVALECQVSLAQLFIKGILHQNILESQLLAGQCIDMRSVRTAGQMLGTIIETVIFIEFKITSGQRVTPRHIDISGILGLGTVLPERIGFSLRGKTEMLFVGQPTIFQTVAFLADHPQQTGPGSISIVRLVAIRGAEKGSFIRAGGTVDILRVRLCQQFIDEKGPPKCTRNASHSNAQ